MVNAGNEGKHFIVEQLHALGYAVAVLNAVKVERLLPFVEDWILADTTDVRASHEAVGTYLASTRVDGIVTFWEDDVLLCAGLVSAFGYRGVPSAAAAQIRDKLAFRKTCAEKGVPHPRHWSVGALPDGCEGVRFPVVIKPSFGASSACVKRCDDPGALSEAIGYFSTHATSQVESALSNGRSMHVEEYILGDEIDIDVVLQDGAVKFMSVCDNYGLDGPYFREKGQSLPTRMGKAREEAVKRQATDVLVAKFGLTDGCFNFEAKVAEDGGLTPIEINLRMGGDEVWFFNRAVWGTDLVELAAMAACGEAIGAEVADPAPRACLLGEYLLPERAGTILDFSVDVTSLRRAGVVKYEFVRKKGDSVGVPPQDYSFLGWFVIQAPSHELAAAAAEAARASFWFDVA